MATPPIDAHFRRALRQARALEATCAECLQACTPPALRMAFVEESAQAIANLADAALQMQTLAHMAAHHLALDVAEMEAEAAGIGARRPTHSTTRRQTR